MKSGLKAAGQEFVFGIYDGISGLVVQPYTGARDNGTTGFVKGIGMGLTGFVLKDLAAIIGPFGYTLKGMHKELLKSKQPTHFIRRARILQGQRDRRLSSPEQRTKDTETVRYGWSVMQELWSITEEMRSSGLKGRIGFTTERRTWRANGEFENVDMAEKVLEARKKGESLHGIFEKQQEELVRAEQRKRDVADDILPKNGRDTDS